MAIKYHKQRACSNPFKHPNWRCITKPKRKPTALPTNHRANSSARNFSSSLVEQKITITPQADTSPWTFPQTPQADASPWSKVEARIPPPSNTTAGRAGGENKNLKDLEQAQPNSSGINNKARQLPNFQMSNWYAQKQSHRTHKHFPSKWQLVRILLSCSQVITTQDSFSAAQRKIPRKQYHTSSGN